MSDQPEPRDPLALAAELVSRLREYPRESQRYQREEEIGRGGMGVIYKVRDGDLNRVLAMKVLLAGPGAPGSSHSDPKSISRFLEEAQVTGQLDHPGIVPVHELGRDHDGCVYFTMRYVKGRNLKDIFDLVRRREEGWTVTRALGVMLKICEAMAYAHDKRVIHRDLKPSNIMVGRFGEVYVLDWGLARVLSDDRHQSEPRPARKPRDQSLVTSRRPHDHASSALDAAIITMDGDVVGTPAYMSPEQAQGKLHELTARADVYSVGAMLYELLAGQMPFVPAGTSVSQHVVLMRLLEGPPRPLFEWNRALPVELVAVCEKAMARDPAARYANMQELGEDLRAFLENRVVTAHATGAYAELKKWIGRNKVAASLTAAVIVVLVVGLIVSLTLKGRADHNAALARRERANVLRLSAFKKLEDLEREADTLWPAVPTRVADYDAWLGRAGALVAGLEPDAAQNDPGFRRQFEALAARSLPAANGGGAIQFADEQDRWWHAQLAKLIAAIEAFADPTTGLMHGASGPHGWGIERRRAFASTVSERSVAGAEAAALWADAIASIEDVDECPRYQGLTLTPQLGLLPIGRDPGSGLWEFAHLQTGDVPRRNPSGELVIDDDSALVFVLIPTGRFFMGAQRTQPGSPQFDPDASENEPLHSVEVKAFFLAKYEMTQGQWLRITGSNPSAYPIGVHEGASTRTVTARHPVENVSWRTCMRVMKDLGLALPTDEEWEYTARAGTTTPWSTGADAASLEGAANLCDRFARQSGAPWQPVEEWLDDRHTLHAPVGSYRANAFGLHDVHGNVAEWCRSPTVKSGGPGADTATKEDGIYVERGGSFSFVARDARSAKRSAGRIDDANPDRGLRPSRAIE